MTDKPVKLTPTDKQILMIPLVCSACGHTKNIVMPGPHSRRFVTADGAYHPWCEECGKDRMHPLSTKDLADFMAQISEDSQRADWL